MAWHHIDAPTKRSLDWIEQKVHGLLWEGLTPEQVALKCRKPLKKGWSLSGDAPDSIYDIMSRIREKGHELPVINNKEDEDVQKYTDKQKEKAIQLFEQGMKPMAIAEKMKINYKTLCKWVSDYKKQKVEFEARIDEGSKAELADDFDPYEFMSAETPPVVVNADTDIDALEKAWAEYEAKKEPAQAATCTDSESESLGKNSDPIITENTEIVKALPEALPTVVFDAILEKREAILKMIAAEEQHLKSLYADLAVLDEFICREGVVGE